MDGQRQRQALTAAERSLRQLADDRPQEARRAAARAAELDQVGAFAGLPDAVEAAAAALPTGLLPDHLQALENAVGPGPLAALLDPLRAKVIGSPDP